MGTVVGPPGDVPVRGAGYIHRVSHGRGVGTRGRAVRALIGFCWCAVPSFFYASGCPCWVTGLNPAALGAAFASCKFIFSGGLRRLRS